MAEFTPEELATINEIMRQQDPGSVVREGEMTPNSVVGQGEMTPEKIQQMKLIMQLLDPSGVVNQGEMTPQQMMDMIQPVQPQNFGALPPQQGPVGSGVTSREMEMMRGQMQQPQEMQGEQGKAQYLQQQIEAIRSRMGGGAPQTGSQRVMDAMGALPAQQAGSAMTDQEIAMMRGQR